MARADGRVEAQGLVHTDNKISGEPRCSLCFQRTTLRECWGCHRWYCYDCLVEHMMICPDWLIIKGDYEIIFECNKHKTCDECPLRFKCYTKKKLPKGK
jgi:hypothetical protein